MAEATLSFEERVNLMSEQETRRIVEQKLRNFDPNNMPVFLLDLKAAQESVNMKPTFFDDYVRNEPEIKLIERHPINKETGEVSKKPFWLPSEFEQAIKAISKRWELKINM